MADRLQKVLSAFGVTSRRRAEALIAEGRVAVNGQRAHVGQLVDPDRDVILVDGFRVQRQQSHRYVAFNKPPGVVTSLRSTHGERTVADLIDPGERLIPVGRLDKETSGLLLFTNDGGWANLVTHPRFGIEKEYEAEVRGAPDRRAIERLRSGVILPDGVRTAPARITVIRQVHGGSLLSVTVIEGRKRQIRLMMAGVGHPVQRLRRVRIGDILLGGLRESAWRDLRREEVESIRAGARAAAQRSGTIEAADRD